MNEQLNANSLCGASLIGRTGCVEKAKAQGVYTAKCFDKDGNLKWEDTFDNVVCTVGKNKALDEYLAGAAYTVTGPYMGLISSVDWSEVLAANTMAAHAGWKEAGDANAPSYSGPRKTCAWDAAAAGAKALSAALAFTFTGSGTVKGCFLVFHTGAVSTNDNTNGTLYSAGVFTGGDRIVVATDVLNVSYSTSL